jgi:hypothetical protein
MCYMVYLSTDCADDLALRSSEWVRFEAVAAQASAPCPRCLNYGHRWFVGSKSGCSCTFRHLGHESAVLGFGLPEHWCPEDQDQLEATHEFYGILKDIVERGYRVDVVDCWSGDEGDEAVALDVSLTAVPADHFRLFEGYVFDVKL